MTQVIALAKRRALGACLASIFLFSPPAVTASSPTKDALTLHQAVTQALRQHPRLRVFHLRQQNLSGQRQLAALAPAYRVEAEVENFAGQGEMSGLGGSEQTLALSSIIELGDKRSARVAVIDARTGRLDVERQAEALSLVSNITQRFVRVLATQQRLQLAHEALTLADTSLAIVSRRATAGAAPESEVLTARAAKTRAQLAVAQVERELSTQRMKLAALLGDTSAEFGPVTGQLFNMPTADGFEELYERASTNPAIERFTHEQQLRDAELQLARADGAAEIEWRLGVRREEATGDLGLVGSASLPLFAGHRSRGAVASARAARDQVRLERQDALLRLHAQLFEAYTYRQQSIDTVDALREQVIPALTEALDITREAYENGRYSYLEWLAAQRELLSAKQSLIDAAASALTYGAVIEQFTAEPLSGAVAPTRETYPHSEPTRSNRTTP